ncbi:MAG: DUF3872 domain-containing protein [Cytophagaceae bacterium]|nr:MAG: DUF3872 domain-containing protein [Cytophagaceae bacterium]
MRPLLLSLLVSLLMLSCNTDSLTIQTQFPFTITNEPLPTAVKVGAPATFGITITPERLTSLSQYSLRWRNQTDTPGTLYIDYTNVVENKATALKTLTPFLRFTSSVAGSNNFELIITDQNNVSQTLNLTVTTNAQ